MESLTAVIDEVKKQEHALSLETAERMIQGWQNMCKEVADENWKALVDACYEELLLGLLIILPTPYSKISDGLFAVTKRCLEVLQEMAEVLVREEQCRSRRRGLLHSCSWVLRGVLLNGICDSMRGCSVALIGKIGSALRL